jgi:hypothetical protein
MAPSTERERFRQVLAQVAEQARAILPTQVNGRIESAVKLVLQGDVEPLDDGTVTVGSSDPTRWYHLVGPTCTCKDFVEERAPEGWCKHRISANLQRSVERVLARRTVLAPVVDEEPAHEDWPPDEPLAEAPASQHTVATLPEAAFSLTLKGTLDGVDALLTVRGQTVTEFQTHLTAVRGLLDRPTAPAQTSPAASPAPPVDAVPPCAYHGPLKASTKAPGTWYCPAKMADGSYCPSRYPTK